MNCSMRRVSAAICAAMGAGASMCAHDIGQGLLGCCPQH
jgi:hypothetical protein